MQNKRFLLDKLATRIITLSGLSIIVFVLLVFIYLFRQVTPLFDRAQISPGLGQNLLAEEKILYSGMSEDNNVIIKVRQDGRVSFYDLNRGITILEESLPLQDITAVAKDEVTTQLLTIADRTGQVLVFGYEFIDDFSFGRRLTKAKFSYPLGKRPLKMSTNPIKVISGLTNEDSSTIIGYDESGKLFGRTLLTQTNAITGEVNTREEEITMPSISIAPDFIQLFDRQRHFIIAAAGGDMLLMDIQEGEAKVKQNISLGNNINAVEIMLGANSVIIADNSGKLSQFFMVAASRSAKDFPGTINPAADEEASFLQRIRSFSLPSSAIQILPVRSSKSFIALTVTGDAIFINAPSGKESFNLRLANNAEDIASWAISPRSDSVLVIEKSGHHKSFKIDNPHPDISIKRLFGKVWYEGYDEPGYIWQSTSGSNDFEPKFSLIPLTFGTLKAAIYAMIFSAPLAIAGAIYTAFFMGSGLRRKIKPIIEMMEAFPTVILGFIAGIIMAPYFEKHLPGIFTILLLLPPSVIAFGFAWRRAKARLPFLNKLSESMVVIPMIVGISWLLLELSPFMENGLFGGDMRTWLNQRGFDYNQRNALVIGVAMGLAVIPTIYSIAEDAIYSVPRLMINGAYALGATPLQNTITIVIPAALSGITSALMIGFGRAVGETMIVLMATGNTPVMDMSIFTGMRTLAANIAVEMPEAAAGSTHFRVLFLCGLLLLLFTFGVNVIAEIIRTRIRKKYANI